MIIEILALHTYHGPNMHAPQPGVLLQVRCNKNRSQRIKDALKDGAQYVGLVLGYLDVTAQQHNDLWLISAFFSTPQPAIGAALAEYVVAGIRATVQGDEEWDRDTPLYELQRRRRREAPPLPLLQLEAEARVRDLPLLWLPDGGVRLGYGARSCAIDLAATTLLPPEWDTVGRIPIVAIVGGVARKVALEYLATTLAHLSGLRVLDAASFEAAQGPLADPDTRLLLLGLPAQLLAKAGAPFDRCRVSVLLDLGNAPPAAPANDDEWARALGVAMLLTEPEGTAVLSKDHPALVALAEHAPCRVEFVSSEEAWQERLSDLVAQALGL